MMVTMTPLALFVVALSFSFAPAAHGLVIVTGANGRTGSLVYKGFKAAGQETRALVRPSAKYDLPDILGCQKCDESEGIFFGEVTNSSSLTQAFAGVDTVFIAVGVSGGQADPVIEDVEFTAVKNQVEALMNQNGSPASASSATSKRVFLLSSMGTDNPKTDRILYWKGQAEDYIMSSPGGINFIILEPCGLADDSGNNRELLVGHDDSDGWFDKGFYMISRVDVANVAVAAVANPPADKLRFDLCAKLPGSGHADVQSVLKQAATMPWKRPSANTIVV